MIDNAHPRRRDGFTLTETLVVITILGFVTIVIAAVFTIIVRTNPSTEARSDDARSLLGLTNWVSQDVLSTAETGFENSAAAARCNGLPGGSTSILQLRWNETDSYVANYRWVPSKPGYGKIVRWTCIEGQTADSVNVSSELRELDASGCGTSPASECPVPVNVDFGTLNAVEFSVFVTEDNGSQRELLVLDSSTANVMSTLPPISGGPSPTNRAPTAGPGFIPIVLGSSATLDLSFVTHDPDGDPLTTTFTGVPSGWNVTAIGLAANITPDPAAVPGAYTFNYTVQDTSSSTANSTITVEVQPVTANQYPVVGPVEVTAGAAVPLTIALPASDPESQPLTASLSLVPGSWAPSIIGLNVTLTPPSSAAGTYYFKYTVTDDMAQSSTSTLTVNVCDASIDSVVPSVVRVTPPSLNLESSVQVDISDNGFCSALVLGYKPHAIDTVESTQSFSGSTTVVIGATDHTWDFQNRNVTLSLREGANGAAEDTDILRTTKN